MTFALYPTTFVDDTTVIPADFLNNYVRVPISRAIDGTGGSAGTPYTPSTPILFGGDAVRFNSGATLTILSGGTLSIPSGGILSAASGSLVTLGGTNTVSGASTFSAAATFNAAVDLNGATTADDFEMTGANKVKVASRSKSVMLDVRGFIESNFVEQASIVGYAQDGVGTAGAVKIPIRVPHGVTLTAVAVYLDAAGGHGALPATMPSVSVRRCDPTQAGVDVSTLGTSTDGSANVAAYEVPHAVTVSGLTEVVDRTLYGYAVRVTGETGANSAVGLLLHGFLKITYTITAYDED